MGIKMYKNLDITKFGVATCEDEILASAPLFPLISAPLRPFVTFINK